MDKLVAKSACAGLLPLTIGGAQVTDITPSHITSLAPYNGQEAALSQALKKAHGLTLPSANEATENGAMRAVWGGTHVYLVGGAPDAALATHAALTDQTDAWSMVKLQGQMVQSVLARLVPVDVRLTHFPVGRAVRTKLAHLSVSLVRVSDDAFVIMAFRSMAKTLVHDLKEAMTSLQGRGSL